MKRASWLALLAGGICLAPLAGCGYTQKMTLPSGIRTIHVETFQNKVTLGRFYAYEPGLEIKITNAVINRLQQDGNLKVVGREEADAALEGDLIAFDQEGTRFTGLERIEEYRLYVVVALRLKNVKSGQLIWEENNFSGDASYFLTDPRAVSRTFATDLAIERLAHSVVDRIVEDW